MFDRFRNLAFAAVLAALPGAASAATVTVLADSTQGAGNTADVYGAGYSGAPVAGASWSSDPTWTPPPGNESGVAQSPFNNTGLANSQSYFSVGAASVANAPNGAASPATLTFAVAQSAFRILWGSIDDYNEIVFNLTGGGTFSYDGDQLATLLGIAPPLVTNYEHVALVSFTGFGGLGTFDSVTFHSHGAAAFEFALAPVPLPAGGLLLAMALGGLALLRRRRAA